MASSSTSPLFPSDPEPEELARAAEEIDEAVALWLKAHPAVADAAAKAGTPSRPGDRALAVLGRGELVYRSALDLGEPAV